MRIFTLLVATLTLLCALTRAECPNGCSGNGNCQSKDMCNCYKNYQGNDCADRTCQFHRAHVDTPKGDIDFDQERDSPGWILTNSQQSPAGTWEYFYPDAKQHEAHFYMECANKGICDRSTGICECFDGYEGAGCQRTACPNMCSGHGTCESISELASKATGTLVGRRTAPGTITYNLWDAKTTYGCRCDPGFTGTDCSKRSCSVGVDPLYKSVGVPIYETFIIHIYSDAASVPANSWFQLRLFDNNGESYVTSRITTLGDASTSNADADAAATEAAIEALPNRVFKDVTCERIGKTSGALEQVVSLRGSNKGISLVCQFNTNPGKVRLPEIHAASTQGDNQVEWVTGTTLQGENDDWFPTKAEGVTTNTVSGTSVSVTLSGSATTASTIGSAPKLLKIDQNIVVASTVAAGSLTLAYALQIPVPTDSQIFTTAGSIALSAPAVSDVAVGANQIEVDSSDGGYALAVGDTIIFHNQIFIVQSLTTSTGSNVYVGLDRRFAGNSNDGDKVDSSDSTQTPIYEITPPTGSNSYSYVIECAGRGECQRETGICRCYKGYTDDNCARQNILAI